MRGSEAEERDQDSECGGAGVEKFLRVAAPFFAHGRGWFTERRAACADCVRHPISLLEMVIRRASARRMTDFRPVRGRAPC
jgi:hypothetical protein